MERSFFFITDPLRRGLAALAGRFVAERERWSLWLVVAIGAGVGGYFSLPVEPPVWHGQPVAALTLLALFTGIAVFGRRRPGVALPALALAACALGFTAAQGRALSAAAPVIERPTRVVEVSGRVLSVEERARGPRVVFDSLSIATLAPENTPETVRLTLLRRSGAPPIGAWISVRAKLMPPPEPAVAGGFQFGRQAWFARLGGVGYALSPWTLLPEAKPPSHWERTRLLLAEFRHRLTLRLIKSVGGEEGAIAAALVTGERAAISDELNDAYRDSGIAHLLSISGLHMSLVSGLVFVGVRGLLALIPVLALRFDIKKWTAAVALLAAFAYLMISGADVPTQRSFLMVGLVLVAVLLDRTAISMRSVAWAAAAVLLWQPESLVGPSFQMSFAAVVALVAVYETLARRRRRNDEVGWLGKAGLYLGAVLLTTLVAGLASSPYAAYHFNRFTSYSLVTNLAVIPLTGAFVMPMALVGVLLMPFGLEAPALWVMKWGLSATNAIAREVASWPGATMASPSISTTAILLVTGGGLWLCLWRHSWRLAGVVPILFGFVLPYLERPPDVLVSGDGKLMAVRAGNGGLALSPGRGDRMVREAWMARYGGPDAPWDSSLESLGESLGEEEGDAENEAAAADSGARLACDSLGCIYTARGQSVALVRTLDALAEDCATASVVVSVVPARRGCRSPKLVIDRFGLWRGGAHALWLEPDGVRVETVADAVGKRPWTPRRWREKTPSSRKSLNTDARDPPADLEP